MEQNKNYELKEETVETIQEKIESIAASYLPEWKFSRTNPDVGSVIALIFAQQTEQTMQQYNHILQECQEELIRLTGVKKKSASPARTVVAAEMAYDAPQGLKIKRGSRFLGTNPSALTPVSFRALHETMVSGAKLKHVLGISEKESKIVSYKWENGCLPLFVYEGANQFKERLQVEHSALPQGVTTWERFYKEGMEIKVADARIRAWGAGMGPDFIHDGTRELTMDKTAIFGEELQLYKECYIGQEEVFAHPGSQIVFEFEVEWEEWRGVLNREEDLGQQLVRQRQRGVEKMAPVPVYAQEVILSYFNGKGFRNVSCGQDITHMFEPGEGKKSCRIEFSCPCDWQPIRGGGHDAKCLRLQIVRCDGCYLPQSIHYYPVLGAMSFSYTYPETGMRPNKIISIQGALARDLTKDVFERNMPQLFRPFPYGGEAVLFGLDGTPSVGAGSIFFQFESMYRPVSRKLGFSCSSGNGFVPVKTRDYTDGFSKSGVIIFEFPHNTDMLEIEGRTCFWIRVEDMTAEDEKGHAPCIKGFFLNGVEVENVEVSRPKEYYLEEVHPYMEAELSGKQVLSVEVWVNEIKELSNVKRESMLLECSEIVCAEYDLSGRMTAFFVKWEEIPDLADAPDQGRCYELDREKKQVRFGDGKRIRIPQNISGVAYRIIVTSCNGDEGNLPGGSIKEMKEGGVFVHKVLHPSGATGGSDLEDNGQLHKRGSSFLCTGGRIVSEKDYVKKSEEFSNQIAQAACRVEQDKRIVVTVLMKDFQNGSESFLRICGPLKKYLEAYCDVQNDGRLTVIEPVFVSLSLSVWIRQDEESSDSEDVLERHIQKYIDSIPMDRGRGIGSIPKVKELEMMLYSAGIPAVICRFYGMASFKDEWGEWNVDLKKIPHIPSAVCINGRHCIYRC